MSLKKFLIIIMLTDAVAWGAWTLLLFTTNPLAGPAIIFLFYLILFLAFFGLLATMGLLVRAWRQKSETTVNGQVTRSFRQAIFLSFLIIVTLWLAAYAWLRWWNVLLVIAVLAVGEHWFLHKEQPLLTPVNN